MTDYRLHGVRIVHAGELDPNTPQTPGMNRAAAITAARGGADKLWAGTVVVEPKAKTGAHHHGHVESVIYVVSGNPRMRWGDRVEFTADAGRRRNSRHSACDGRRSRAPYSAQVYGSTSKFRPRTVTPASSLRSGASVG